MSVVSNSSTASTFPKPPTKKAQSSLKSNRRQVIIKPRQQPAPISLKSRPVPSWLFPLRSLQRRFGIATYMLIAGMLVAYGSTVYLQQKWSQEYRKLENLQRYERQLTTTNEALKNQLASEAEQPDAGLISPNPAMAVILQVSTPKGSKNAKSHSQPQPKIDIPVGY